MAATVHNILSSRGDSVRTLMQQRAATSGLLLSFAHVVGDEDFQNKLKRDQIASYEGHGHAICLLQTGVPGRLRWVVAFSDWEAWIDLTDEILGIASWIIHHNLDFRVVMDDRSQKTQAMTDVDFERMWTALRRALRGYIRHNALKVYPSERAILGDTR